MKKTKERTPKTKQLIVSTEKVRQLDDKRLETVVGGCAEVCAKSWGVISAG